MSQWCSCVECIEDYPEPTEEEILKQRSNDILIAAARALLNVLDGIVEPEKLSKITGLPIDECEFIFAVGDEARKLIGEK